MSRIGFLVLYATGHLNPSIALGRALQKRGHEVVFFNVPDVAAAVAGAGLNFVSFGEAEYPPGALGEAMQKIGESTGQEAFAQFIERMSRLARTSFQHLPELFTKHRLDLLVIDQVYPGGSTLAEHAGIPFISLANALLVNREDTIPPPAFLWRYDVSDAAVQRNRKGWAGLLHAFEPVTIIVNEQRRDWLLPPYSDFLEDSFSRLAQICQLPAIFDFPRHHAPSTLHFVGHLEDDELARSVPFPWDRLDGRPLIYASLGTLQNRLEWVFRSIIEACSSLDAQTVVSLGPHGLAPQLFDPCPANVFLLPYVPQPELLKRATLCITHAGLNTSLECLGNGVPAVCIPIASEQPGVAMRMEYLRSARVIALADLNAAVLKEAITEVLSDPLYRSSAETVASHLRTLNPTAEAARIIEDVLSRAQLS